ncbi:MAG: GPW/gp25 family protein [Blastocatellia bacterium]
MATDLSIFGRLTQPANPQPNQRPRAHTVTATDEIVAVANQEYKLVTYDPDRWRGILDANGIENPFTMGEDYLGKRIVIPPPPAPNTPPPLSPAAAQVLTYYSSPLGTSLAYPPRPDGRGGLATVSDEDAVRDHIIAIIESPRGSHLMEPWFGIPRLPFRSVSSFPALALTIKKAIILAEDRIDPDLLDVQIGVASASQDPGLLPITINYVILGEATPRTLSRGYRLPI